MLAAPSTSWVWPLGQDPNQWNSLLQSMQVGRGSPQSVQGSQQPTLPGVNGPSGTVPGVPWQQASPGQDTGPSEVTRNLQLALQALRTGRSLLDVGNVFAQSPDLATGSAGAGTAGGLAGAGLGFAQGNYGPATLSLLQSGAQGTRAANQLGFLGGNAGALGSSLGGALGLAGVGYGLSQGDPHALGGLVSSAGQVASGAGSLLGYSAPAFGALGAGTTGAGAGTAALASGTELGAATILGTLGEALGPLGLVLGLGVLGDVGISALQDKWKALIPEIGQSAKNPTSTRSFLTGQGAADYTRQQIPGMSLNQLFNLPDTHIVPNAEMVYQYDPQLRAQAQAGDPQALAQYLQGMNILSGETGAASPNDLLTDAYQRAVVSKLSPMLQAQVLGQPGFSFKQPADYFSPSQLSDYQHQLAIQQMMGGYNPALGPNDPMGYLTGSLQLSPYFRSAEQRGATQNLISQSNEGQIQPLAWEDLTDNERNLLTYAHSQTIGNSD